MATLLTNATARLEWVWDDTTELSSTFNTAKLALDAAISDVSVANVVWADSRTIAPGVIETIDLSALPVEALDVHGEMAMIRAHKILISNRTTPETLAQANELEATLRVGLPDNQTAGHYALAVGYSSWSMLYSREGWLVSEPLAICNPSETITIPFDIVIIGQGEITNA